MELYRDLMFKRNINGYTEETRVQVYFTYVRQIPLWVVYHPHNQELDLLDVAEHGHWFLRAESVILYFDAFKKAWAEGGEYIPSIDLTQEAIEGLRNAKPDEDGLMYRVIYNCPAADISICAMGSDLYDPDKPRFVSDTTYDIGRWCIYNEHVAKAVMRMHSVTPYGGYVYERIRDNPDGGMFIVQSAPYHPSGNPPNGAVWSFVEDAPHWNKRVYLKFNEDMSDIVTVYDPRM